MKKTILLIPAALVAFQTQAAAPVPVKLPITQKNYESWLTPLIVDHGETYTELMKNNGSNPTTLP